MNMDCLHAAKVVSDFLQADDSAYEHSPDVAFESGKAIISALQGAGFKLTHTPLPLMGALCPESSELGKGQGSADGLRSALPTKGLGK